MTRFDDWRASAGDELCSVTPSGVVADALYPEPEPQTVGPTLGRSAARMAVCMAYDDADVARTGARMHRELAEVAAGTAAPATAWVRLDRAARIGASHRHEDAIHVGKGGVVAVLAEDLAALRGPTGVRVILDAGGNALPVAALAAAAGTAAELAFDPIGAWAVDGMLPASLSNLRKFLEAYLFFKYPVSMGERESHQRRVERFFQGEEATEPLVQRVVNELSHLAERFDRSVQPVDIPEINKIAAFVLEAIRRRDPDQYTCLLESVGRDDPLQLLN